MCHYQFASHRYSDAAGVFLLDDQRVYVDTASSEKDVHHMDNGSGHSYLTASVDPASPVTDWQLQRWQRTWRLKSRQVQPVATCAQHGASRDHAASSGTAVAVVTAAELSLRLINVLPDDEFLSVSAIEEFTTLLAARQSVSTLYHTLDAAKQVGFLRERHVDPLSNRFLGTPDQWKRKRIELHKYVLLNEQETFRFRLDAVMRWLDSHRPVIVRVDPRKLLHRDGSGPLPITRADGLSANQHHAVVITDIVGQGSFVVRTGWKRRPEALMPLEAPTEAWGMLFKDEDHCEQA